MDSTSRRDFLKQLAAAGAGLSALGTLVPLAGCRTATRDGGNAAGSVGGYGADTSVAARGPAALPVAGSSAIPSVSSENMRVLTSTVPGPEPEPKSGGNA